MKKIHDFEQKEIFQSKIFYNFVVFEKILKFSIQLSSDKNAIFDRKSLFGISTFSRKMTFLLSILTQNR